MPANLDEYLNELLEKRAAKAAPQAVEAQQSQAADLSAQNDQNAFNALLNKSAAMAGSLGGKVADSSGAQALADNLNKGNQQYMAQNQVIAGNAEKAQTGQEKVAEYLLGKRQQDQQFQAKQAETEQYHQDQLENRKQIANQMAESRRLAGQAGADARAQAAQDRADKQSSADFDKFSNRLSGTARDSIGNEKMKLRTTTHALAILDGMNTVEDFNKLTPMQINELGAALATTLSPGSPALTTIQEMTPQTASKKLAEVAQYLFNEPVDAKSGKFVEQFKHMLDRQKDVSAAIIQGEISPIVANYKHLKDANPDRFKDILNEYGATVDDQGKITAYTPPYQKNLMRTMPDKGHESGTAIAAPAAAPPQAHPQASAAMDWAKKNPNDPRAKEIMGRLGGGQ